MIKIQEKGSNITMDTIFHNFVFNWLLAPSSDKAPMLINRKIDIFWQNLNNKTDFCYRPKEAL